MCIVFHWTSNQKIQNMWKKMHQMNQYPFGKCANGSLDGLSDNSSSSSSSSAAAAGYIPIHIGISYNIIIYYAKRQPSVTNKLIVNL